MELVLIRHFQTEGNGKGQYIGSTDEPLDECAIPKYLSGYPKIDHLAVSPMKRCIQTADLIYPSYDKIICPLLRELDFGEYERKTYEELKDKPEYQRWIDSGGLGAFPGGEDRVCFQKRCMQGMELLIKELTALESRSAGVVVHGGTIMAVMSACDRKKRPFYEWQVGNGEGYVVSIDVSEWEQGDHCFRNIRKIRRNNNA